MEKKVMIYVFLVLVIIFSTSCNSQVAELSEAKEGSKKLVVYASIYPMYDFAGQIGKDKVDLRLMVPPGAEPHAWEPTAKLMGELEKADVLIFNGAGMEMWSDKVVGSLNNKELIVVNASEGIKLRRFSENGEEHDHNTDHEHYNNHQGEYDPHVWLDPVRAMKQAENIKDAFIKADEENKEFYESNYNEFAHKLKLLDEKFKKELSNIRLNKIVVAHGAFGYLTERYGLEQISVAGLTPQEEPSGTKLARISDIVRDNGIRYIFFETLTSPKLAKVIAEETGAHTGVLNPIGGLTEEQISEGKDYLSIMEENLRVLKKALQ